MNLNFGAGATRYEDYINLDVDPINNPEICVNIFDGIPLESKSVDKVKAMAVLEHFGINQLRDSVLPELWRIMKVGGEIEVLVPDLETLVKRYLEYKRTGETPYRKERPGSNYIYDAEDLDFWIMSDPSLFGSHKVIFDYDFLALTMIGAGFRVKQLEHIDHNLYGIFVKVEKNV